MIAIVLPGQGSQQREIGQGLFDDVQEYQSVEQEIDAIVGYSMRNVCLDDCNDQLKQTQYTQPSHYVVNALHFYQVVSQSASPNFLAGHSLGEYNALFVSGVFDFLTGLQLVKKRGELMSWAQNGAMAAAVGLSNTTIKKVLNDDGIIDLDVANVNASSLSVVSDPIENIERIP